MWCLGHVVFGPCGVWPSPGLFEGLTGDDGGRTGRSHCTLVSLGWFWWCPLPNGWPMKRMGGSWFNHRTWWFPQAHSDLFVGWVVSIQSGKSQDHSRPFFCDGFQFWEYHLRVCCLFIGIVDIFIQYFFDPKSTCWWGPSSWWWEFIVAFTPILPGI